MVQEHDRGFQVTEIVWELGFEGEASSQQRVWQRPGEGGRGKRSSSRKQAKYELFMEILL